MSEAVANQRFVLSDADTDPERGILHVASPFIIGLVGAVVGMELLAPGMMRQPHLVASALLVPSLIICVGIYAWSVISPGDIVGLVVDRAERSIELLQSNAFASRRTEIAFEDVARVAIEDGYDKDGYAQRQAVLTLSTGERLPLAFAIDDHWVGELRRAIGLASR